jgi:peptidyl-prolyl cis-trans isomerase SurA
MMLMALLPHGAQAQKRQDGIAVVVGNAVITQSDINDRLGLIISSSGLPNQPDIRDRVRPQVVAMLIEEEIKRAHAKRLKLSVDPADVDKALTTIAEQNRLSLAEFKKMLAARRVSVKSLRDQIEAQMMWSRVVGRELRPQITVREQDITAELERLTSLIGQNEYLLAEILLVADNRREEATLANLASRLMSELRANPNNFPRLAQQFSRAAGAAQGGSMGWVTDNQIPKEIADKVRAATKGALIGPVKTNTGTSIILVRDIRTRTTETLPDREAIATRLGNERLDRLQRGYYQDLRGATFVEQRP